MAKELRVIAPIVPAGDFEVANAKDIKAGDKRLDVALAEAAAEVAKKANKTDVNNELNKKASTEYVNAELSKKADKTDVDAELVTKANKIDTETALAGKASVEGLASANEAIADLSTEQAALSARMDTFTRLEEGSTTGDAELADGRVGADGKTYENIGGAIRGQVTGLKSDLSQQDSLHFEINHDFISCGITHIFENKSHWYKPESKRIRTKCMIPVNAGDEIYINDDTLFFDVILKSSDDSKLYESGWSNSLKYKFKDSGLIYILCANGADYSTSTSISVSDLKGTISIANNNIQMFKLNYDDMKRTIEYGNYDSLMDKDKWARLSLSSSTLEFVIDTKRISYYEFIKFAKGSIIQIDTKQQFVMYSLVRSTDTGMELIETSKWLSGYVKISAKEDCLIAITVANGRTYDESTSIYPSDLDVDIKVYNNIAYNIFTQNNPNEMWKNYLDSKIGTIWDKADSSAFGDSFFFITDYHIETNAGNSHKLIKYIVDNTPIKWGVFGGDILNGSETKAESEVKVREWYRRFNGLEMYSIRGNHDYNILDGGSEATKFSESQMYNLIVKRTESTIVTGETGMYYYRDNVNQKIRYIFADTMHGDVVISNTQLNWIYNRIVELSEEWTVVVFSHYLLKDEGGTWIELGNGAFVGKKVRKAKQDARATVACIIGGHTHYDGSLVVDGLLEIVTTCDTISNKVIHPMAVGTTSEHAFDIFSIDTANRKIYATRIGVGSDRQWDY